MKGRPQMSLAEMAAKAAGTGRLVCPRCACCDFRTYKTIQGHVQTFRYKACRHCGHRFLTTQAAEQAIRSVETVQDDVVDDEDEGDIL
jgi:transcriptional regulator NrdR family protein